MGEDEKNEVESAPKDLVYRSRADDAAVRWRLSRWIKLISGALIIVVDGLFIRSIATGRIAGPRAPFFHHLILYSFAGLVLLLGLAWVWESARTERTD